MSDNSPYGYVGNFKLNDLPAPDVYQCIPRFEIEELARRYCRCQEKTDAIESERQAKKHFCKVMALRHYTLELAEKEAPPLPVDPAITTTNLKFIKRRSPNCLLTINPRPDVTLEQFKKVVEKFLKKKTIKYYFQVYEVRKGETGLHAHVLLQYTSAPYDFQRSTKSTFKSICDANNSAILNFRFIAEDLIPDKIRYMQGEKQKSKQKGVEDTKIYREKHRLEPCRESRPPFPCRSAQKNDRQVTLEGSDMKATHTPGGTPDP